MNRKLTIDPLGDARVVADNAEQMAEEVRRTVAAVKGMVHDLKHLYEVVSPLVERLKSKLAGPSANVQVLVSTKGVR